MYQEISDVSASGHLLKVSDAAGEGATDLELGASGIDGAVVVDARHPESVVLTGRRGRLPDGPRRLNHRCHLPGQCRGDPARQTLMRAFGVIDHVERVDLGLQLLQRLGERLLVEEPEQGLMEPLILALRGRLIGFAGDRLSTE
jgi:hypothetical protein